MEDGVIRVLCYEMGGKQGDAVITCEVHISKNMKQRCGVWVWAQHTDPRY